MFESNQTRSLEETVKEQAILNARGTTPAPRLAMKRETLRLILALTAIGADTVALIAAFQGVESIRDYSWLRPGGVPLLVILLPAYVYFGTIWSSFSTSTLSAISKSASDAWRALFGAVTVVIVMAFVAKFGMKISRSAFFYAIVASGIALIFSRAFVAAIIKFGFRGHLSDRALVTAGSSGENFEEFGTDVFNVNQIPAKPNLNNPSEMAVIAQLLTRYDIVYLDAHNLPNVEAWIIALKATGIACEVLVPNKAIHSAVDIGQLGSQSTLVLSRGPLSFGSRLQKRLFDLAISVPMLIFLAPLLIATAIAIRLESKGPVLFKQNRIGQANIPFCIYKFRSMRVASEDPRGDRSTDRDDDRLTRVGRFIRKTSIDELPQLLNVVRGNMSLVGPRPHAEGSRAGEQLFWEVSELYWMRHALKPGITGLAQTQGYRGATHTRADLEARLRYDLEYLQTWSLWTDVTILFATVKVLVHPNAY